MSTATLIVGALVLLTSGVDGRPRPEQVHIALHENPFAMTINWVTFEPADTVVEYGKSLSTMTRKASGDSKNFTYQVISRFMHNAVLWNLEPETVYYYRVGSRDNWSKNFAFKTLSNKPDFSYRACIFGDLGVENGISLTSLRQAAERRDFDIIIDVGDLAYDLHTDDGKVGDFWMNQMEPIIAQIPFMVVAGNHEDDGKNYSHFVHRYNMPNDPFEDNQLYSFDLGPIHFVGISTEYYGFFYLYGQDPVFNQYAWLQKHLADYGRRRAERPWLVAFQHRPFYCSNENSFECHCFENTLITQGFEDMPGLEGLYIDNGVDLGFWGHEHSYERFFPISRRMVYNLSDDPYHNAPAPTYIITGSAGCHSKHSYFDSDPAPGSAARFVDYGYSILHVHNRTHLFLEQISVERGKDAARIDEVWLTKDEGHQPSALIARRHATVPFPPRAEPRSCHVDDPRCRWAERRRSSTTTSPSLDMY